jgi:hypothetical protein
MNRRPESAEDELLVERFEIVDTEQSGGSEPDGEPSGGDESSEDEERPDVIWEGGPEKK